MFCAKVHKSYRTVVAICDSELVGKKFEEGKRQLDCRENFYKDKELNHEELKKLIRMQLLEDATFNIVGEQSIKLAIEEGAILENGFDKIAGIPFALKLI